MNLVTEKMIHAKKNKEKVNTSDIWWKDKITLKATSNNSLHYVNSSFNVY